MRVNRGVWLLVCLFLAVSLSVAQSPNGTVSGIVLDPSGGVIVGASVLIINNATGVEYPGKANSEGYYVVPNIPPGTYRIQVSNSGFKTIIKPDIVVHVEDALAINFTLPIGAASEIVTVEGGAPLVNTQDAAVSTVIDRQFLGRLPLNGRSFNTLLQLTPGVVIVPSTPTTTAGQFSIAGERTNANSFTVDGVSANFGVGVSLALSQTGTGGAQALSALGGTSSLVSVDALQEFRIETSSFAPEFGRTPGGQVILTTRSGTNDFHGGVFDYFRNTVMDANNWFNNSAFPPIPRAPEHHNDFGGFLGGRIWTNKTFFFLSYEGARLELPQTEIIEVPSAFARMQASAAIGPFLNAYPLPNGTPASPTSYTAPFTGSFANKATLDAGSVRIDHTFNDRFSIFGRYNDAPSRIVNFTNSLSGVSTTAVDTQTLTVGVNMLLSPRLSNSLRGNYSTQSNATSYSLQSFGGSIPPSPGLYLGNLSSSQNQAEFFDLDFNALHVGSAGRSSTKQVNFTDDLTFSAGGHQLKFGGDYRAIFLNANEDTKYFPIYFALSTQSLVSSSSIDFLEPLIALPAQILAPALSLYGQDTWKVTPRLTLTYGLRWELSPAPSARGNTSLAAWSNVNDPAAIAIAPAGTPLWATTYGNFAPRFGLAYSLTPKGDLILRAGGGVFYDLGVGSSGSVASSFPNQAFSLFFSVPLPIKDLTPYLPTISLQPPYPQAISAFSPDLKLPRSYQWNVAMEKSFGGKQSLSATYVGQAGRDLLRREGLNRPNPNFESVFQLTQNDARSNYNALQIQYRRPLSSRLQALLNYTWSHSLDDVSDDVTLALPASVAVVSGANDYASSDFDVRQSFSGALSYDVPAAANSGPLALLTKDWSVDTVIVARTGFPFNAVITTPSVLGGSGTTRADLVPGQPLYVRGAQCASVFQSPGVLAPGHACPGGLGLNPNAFVIPPTPRQGTEPRNDIAGFGLTQVDLSIGRKFPITERFNLQFRADAFNVFNHPNFTNPFPNLNFGPSALLSTETLNNGLGGLSPLFQEGGPRSLQLSLKLTF